MAIYYSSSYRLPQGSTTVYEAVQAFPREAGILFAQYFTITIPVGFGIATNDVAKLIPYQANIPITVPQIAGIRHARIVLRCSGNAGGAVTANIGFANAGASVYAAASVILQSANTVDVAIATILAGPTLLQADDLQLAAVANATTSAVTLDGYAQFYNTAP